MSFRKSVFVGIMFGVSTPVAAVDAITDWSAAQGAPTDISPPWIRGGLANNVTVSGGSMTVSGKTYFEQNAATTPGFDLARAFSIEASARYVSGSTTNATREGMNIFFTSGANAGAGLYIGNNHIFLATGNASNSAVIALDTTAAFHTYRLDVSAPGGNGLAAISVYYDDALKLSGSTFVSSQYNGPDQRFDFGGGSSLATATSQWKFVRDYFPLAAGTVPEPATWAMMLVGFGTIGGALRRRSSLTRPIA